MSIHPKPLESAISFYLVDEEGILFSKTTKSLYRFNTTTTFIWGCYEEGLTPLAIARVMAEKFGISTKIARQDVVRVISKWKDLSLLTTIKRKSVEEQGDSSGIPNQHNRETITLSSVLPPAVFHEHHYQLLDIDLRIRYPCQATEKLVHPVLAHLETRSAINRRACEVTFDVVHNQNSYMLLRDGLPISDCVQLLELAPLIQRQALLAAYEHTDYFMAIHAAAVCNHDKRCFLMPGISGSGKSTLTAALISSGFTYLTDELSLLVSDTLFIRPAQVSLGLKQGS
jgi:hypothetical protein